MQTRKVFQVEARSLFEPFSLASDIANENPLYIYVPTCKSFICWSSSISALLDSNRIKKPLDISSEALSFLLKNGVVPPPYTIYSNIYILSLGGRVDVKLDAGRINIDFEKLFPFKKDTKKCFHNYASDLDILELLSNATLNRLESNRPSFLFHSAGKDSNAIALSIAEAGMQNKVTLLTHRSKGRSDESEISKKIARQLGFKHIVLNEVDVFDHAHRACISDFLEKVSIPCTDNVSLAYPLYIHQMPELIGSNIIDGGGNDSYMWTPIGQREENIIKIANWVSRLKTLRNMAQSESRLNLLARTPAEWCGMSGFSTKDSKKILGSSYVDTCKFWMDEKVKIGTKDLHLFKTIILTSVVATEQHIRKVRNFAEASRSNLVLPWTDSNVVEQWRSLPEHMRFDRTERKNKVLLRNLLNRKMGLDSDSLGKLAFTYDSHSVVSNNYGWMRENIMLCKKWNPQVSEVVDRLAKKVKFEGRAGFVPARLVYSLFNISLWLNLHETRAV